MHGKGKTIFKDGSTYDGDFRNNLKHGMGKYTYPKEDGLSSPRFWDGKWKEGKKNGPGKYKTTQGEVLTGTWSNGNRIGYDETQRPRHN